MRKASAALGSALFLVFVSGGAAVPVPWWLTGGRRAGHWWPPLRLLGLLPLAAGTAVVGVLTGQGLLLARPVLFGYAACVWVLTWTFVRWYEEPGLVRRFGAEYERYRRAVPAWWPRRTPWRDA